MAHTQFRSVLLLSLATALGCGHDKPAFDKPTDTKIAGRNVKIIPYTESGMIWGTNGQYLVCILPGVDSCYSPSAYKAKIADEVDQALKE